MHGQVREDFQQLLQRYSGQTGGKFARLVFADICYRGGALDEAIAHYNEALADFETPFYRHTILNGLGYAYEAKKELSEAAAYFQQVADSPNSALRAEALFNAGRLYAALGEMQKSKRAFQQLAAEQPDSLYAELARERSGDGIGTTAETP